MYKSLFLVFVLASCALAAAQQKQTNKNQKRNKNVVHPCQRNGAAVDLKCVQDNLAANSECNPKAVGSLPAHYQYGEFKFDTPYFNATYIDTDLKITNHHLCYVSEFFFNLKSDVAVITVDCPGLVLASNRTYIQHASFLEDTTYSYSSTWEYPMIRMTANIQNANALNICNAYVYTDVVQLPKFIVTPNDKPTEKYLSHDLSFIPIYERETFYWRGFYLFRRYICASVCNFGC